MISYLLSRLMKLDLFITVGFFVLWCIGIIILISASQSVALSKHLPPYFFVVHHLIYSLIAITFTLSLCTLSVQTIKKIAVFAFPCILFILILTPFIGFQTKGAVRWISFLGHNIQPSEFFKPIFSIFIAWILSINTYPKPSHAYTLAFTFYGISALALMIEPDIGQTFLLTMMFSTQLFVAGIPKNFFYLIIAIICTLFPLAYFIFPHFKMRIDNFINGESNFYQVEQSLKAFSHGGLFGTGPNQGTVKYHIPDAHADFILSIIGEEWGAIFCVFVIFIIFFIAIRSILVLLKKQHVFSIVACTGLVSQWIYQSSINIASAIHLMPPKGMTLPLISYGGSSLIASGISIGFILSITSSPTTKL